MTDPKDRTDIEEVDWDEALAEWEGKAFSPEVARDVVTDKPAALSGATAPRPLYRPPTSPPQPRLPSPPLSAPELGSSESDDDDGGATLIAAIPEELLRRGNDRGRGGGSRGGLGQLFARDSPAETAAEKGTAGREPNDPQPNDPPDVFTSAKSVSSRLEAPAVEPRRRAPSFDGTDAVPEGAFFDPFAEDSATPAPALSTKPPDSATPAPALSTKPPGSPMPKPGGATRTDRVLPPPPVGKAGAVRTDRGAPPASLKAETPRTSRSGPAVPNATEPGRAPRSAASLAPKVETPRLNRSVPAPGNVPSLVPKIEGPRLNRSFPSPAPKLETPRPERNVPSAAPTGDRSIPSVRPTAEDPHWARGLPSVAPAEERARWNRNVPSVAPPSDDAWDDVETAVKRPPGSGPSGAPGGERAPVAWDEAETSIRVPPVAPADQPAPVRSPDRAPLPPAWPDERPGDDWLDAQTRSSFEERAAWLEEEARALADTGSRARGLLVCSELLALVGRRERAQALAAEARDLAETLALAHRQARMLMPWPPDPEDHLESLEIEVKTSAPGPARLHSLLLEAEALRARGDDDGAATRLEQAARMGGADVRAATLRAASALAAGAVTGPALRLPDLTELAPLAQAIRTCLRLRGVHPPSIDRQDGDDRAEFDQSPNAIVLQARQALGGGDLAAAAPIVAELARIPELASCARWLAATFAATTGKVRALSIELLKDLVKESDEAAVGALIARGIEVRDADLVASVAEADARLTWADRLAIATLMGNATAAMADGQAVSVELRPLVCAASAVLPVSTPDRAERAAGTSQSRLEIELGRRLASGARDVDLAAALEKFEEQTAAARAVALELSARGGRVEEVSRIVEGWKPPVFAEGHPPIAALAAALVAERGGATARSAEAFRAAHAADPGCEVALRALASLDTIDQAAQLNALADEWGDGLRSAVARVEAVSRGGSSLPDPTRAHLLELAHRSAPSLPVAAFLAERIARRSGDVDEVLRWIRERRDRTGDPVETALENVREALLVADSDPDLASQRLREAQVVRPRDAALRDLYERMAADRPDDVAAWREQRAAETTGDARFLLFLEATYELERQNDDHGALRCAMSGAAASDVSLARVARERAELRTGQVARLTDELLALAKGASASETRREACERLAVVDAIGRNDAASALLWHRSVLELLPEHMPSLRHVEHHLIGEGREDELDEVAAAIAKALRGGGAGECTAHAELAARLRLRESSGDPARSREMVDIAVGESNPSLWSVRMLQGLALTQNDDAGSLTAAKLVVERLSRPLEMAFLLLRAAEAAVRLDRHAEARSLLERAMVHDPGDVLGWNLLAQVRRQAADLRGAAEATESLARCSGSPRRQLSAWYDAACLWMDEVKDDDRAIAALEAAAALDLAYADVFDRLSRLYAIRKMQSELADLLQRRIDIVVDPDERLAIEVRRGRVLLEVGEVAGARRAFEAALDERPDDPGALSAFADLCIEDRDWQVAEQALVRLARLLPTAEEQRAVYARLGDLYSRHLVNLSRAEVALKEVLKRAPDDLETMVKLVDVHKRQNDPARAIEWQQELIARATSPADKRERILELATLHERVAHDPRRAERTLDAARRDSPQDVTLLRALAEFYLRHQQTSAVNILLDRAAADARRTLASGRVAPEPFHIIAVTFELRGQAKAAAAVLSVLSAVEGKPAQMPGAGERAFDPTLDDALAPELLSPAIRALLSKTGDLLDAASPVDLRDLRATPLPSSAAVSRLVMRTAAAIGLQGVQIFSSPKLGAACLPVGSLPAIVLGESVANDERVGGFLALRGLKLIRARASSLARSTPAEIAVLATAWLKRFHPTWEPQGIALTALNAASNRIHSASPRYPDPDPDVGILALEASAAIDGRQGSLAAAVIAWANRVALLALGDSTAALDAVCAAGLLPPQPPPTGGGGAAADPHERSMAISRSSEARDLVTFAVGDGFAQVRGRLGLKA